MSKVILIDAVYPDETRIVIHENNLIQDFDYETAAKKQIKGNIYLAKVTRVEPSLQAAFIEFGGGKHGFLPFNEIHQDYFHIPISDRRSSGNEDGSVNNDEIESENLEITKKLKSIDPPKFTNDDLEENIVIKTKEADLSSNTENLVEDFEKIDNNQDLSDVPELEYIDAEEIGDDDVYLKRIHNSSNVVKNYRIQEVIKKNQIVLVQVIKEERGNKGASFTTYISLAGRYCVLMPNSDKQSGVSRRIEDVEDRKRLKSIIAGLAIPSGVSVIVRTAGTGRNKAEITRDYDYLVRLWNNIRNHILNSKAPCFIHAEGDLIKRTFRDLYDSSVDEVLIQGESSFKKARDFVKMIMPSHIQKVRQYKGKIPIFCKFQVDEQLSALYSSVAEMKSGGYIVINQTEALITIDVNSGRSTSERNIEETATKTNLEAVHEVARQLRLRDLSGLVVIDFIDMIESRHRRFIEKAMREAVKNDRAKIQIGFISNFGLMEMSRQRLRPSFIEANSIKCSNCNGKGTVRASESNAVLILRTIESEICKSDYDVANLYTHPDVALYMLNYKRDDIAAIETRYNTKIMFYQDMNSTTDSFSIERIKNSNNIKDELPVSVEPIYDDGSIIDEEEVLETHQHKVAKKNWNHRVNKNDADEDKMTKSANSNIRGNRRQSKVKKELPNNVNVENNNQANNLDRYKLPKRRKFIHEKVDRTKEVNSTQIEQKKQKSSLLRGLWHKIIN